MLHLQYAIITFSAAALGFFIVSLTTKDWVIGEAYNVKLMFVRAIRVRYGLFRGSILEGDPPINKTKIFMTCNAEKGICFPSCQETEQERQTELLMLLLGKPMPITCDGKELRLVDLKPEPGVEDRRYFFIDRFRYQVTVYCLSFAIGSSALSIIVSAIAFGVKKRPKWLSNSILYCLNGLAMIFGLAASLKWSVGNRCLKENLAIRETMRKDNPFESQTPNQWGYSFHVISLSIILHAIAIIVIICMEISHPRRFSHVATRARVRR